MGWREAVGRLAHRGALTVEETFDRLVARLRDRMGRRDPVMIQPYRGFGSQRELWLKGRVLEDEGITEASERDTVWRNLLGMYRRFESDEVPGVTVRATGAGAVARAITDGEGYFEVRLRPEAELPRGRSWHEVALELLDGPVDHVGPVRAVGRVRVPHPEAAFGVISDIDDTVLRTGATSLLAMARMTFLHNARTRLPFAGVAAFYRALERGRGGTGRRVPNPVFYVSSSPWNLYDFIEDFLELNDLPAGPLLLRDLGIDEAKFIRSGHDHKLDEISWILAAYPELPFVLVGDSGQDDPEIYRQVVERSPGRVRAIYIRDVSRVARDDELRVPIDAVAEHGVEMRLVADSSAAAAHAASVGLIDSDGLSRVEVERARDEGGPSELERLVAP